MAGRRTAGTAGQVVSLLLCWALLAPAQTRPPAQQPDSDPATFSASSQLVIENVSVTDKSGKPVEGLTANDFTITENGAPQAIRVFEYQKLPEVPSAPPSQTRPVPMPAALARLPQSQIAGSRPGDIRYRDRRLMALYFDMSSMPQLDQLRAIESAEKFIRTQLTSADLVALMQYAGGVVRVLQDFTDDRDRLLSILETLVIGEDPDAAFDDTSDTGAAFGQNDTEFNLFNTDRRLSALQTAANMLGRLSEKKALIYFASGLRLNGVDNMAQLRATENAAIRAGVALWTIDARGLVAQAPMGDASRGSQGGIGMYTGAAATAMLLNSQRSQDTLWALAKDTGGKALLDNNELETGIIQAQKSLSSYYFLGYYTTNQAMDGKFRRVKVTLNNGLSADLNFRQGYFAGKEFSKFTTADKERQLEDALMLEDPITDMTIAMEINYFKLNRAEYFVPIAVKIPGRELALARRGGADHTLIDFIGEVKDEFGTTISNVRDKVDVKVDDATAQELLKRPILYDTGFTLLPGKYVIKFLARDAETGRIGTFQANFTIPNLEREQQRLSISSVVLGSQRVAISDALYTAGKKAEQVQSVNPLVDNGQKLVPSVTHVFSKGKELYVYLQAYQRPPRPPAGQPAPPDPEMKPVVAFVTFYRGAAKAFETPPLLVTEGLDPRSRAVPLKFALALGQLQPGAYTCQVTVLEPDDQKAAFWQAPVWIAP